MKLDRKKFVRKQKPFTLIIFLFISYFCKTNTFTSQNNENEFFIHYLNEYVF